MSTQRLRHPGEPLIGFGQALEIPADFWSSREDLHRLTYREPAFDCQRASALTLEKISPIVESYGEALTCRFLLGDLPVLDLNRAVTDRDLELFRQQTKHSNTVVLDLQLDKAQLVDQWLQPPPSTRIFLYLFPDALERFIQSDLARLEKMLWGTQPATKTILLVPEREIWLDGPHLAILGGDRIPDWQTAVPERPPDLETIIRIYETGQEQLKWQEVWLQHLTPLTLKFETQDTSEDPILNALRVHQVNAILLYTADQTRFTAERGMVATFAGANQRADLAFAHPADPLQPDEADGAALLLALFEWAYHPKWAADRLQLVQIGMAQALSAADPVVRYRLMLLNAANLLEGIRWQWKAFIQGKVEAYTAGVRALEEAVAQTVEAYSDQISSMIKSLSDTMLAAVAALLGSIIASLFRDTFNQTIFVIGMMVYAGYVLIFPLFYNMLNRWGRFQNLTAGFEHRRSHFEDVLFRERVQEIVGNQIDSSRAGFKRWFWLTLLAYLIVISLALTATMLVPELMKAS